MTRRPVPNQLLKKAILVGYFSMDAVCGASSVSLFEQRTSIHIVRWSPKFEKVDAQPLRTFRSSFDKALFSREFVSL